MKFTVGNRKGPTSDRTKATMSLARKKGISEKEAYTMIPPKISSADWQDGRASTLTSQQKSVGRTLSDQIRADQGRARQGRAGRGTAVGGNWLVPFREPQVGSSLALFCVRDIGPLFSPGGEGPQISPGLAS